MPAAVNGVVLTAVPGNGFVPIKYSLTRAAAIELARALLASVGPGVPIQTVIEITPQTNPVPQPTPIQPPPFTPGPPDPRFAETNATLARLAELAANPYSPPQPPPAPTPTGGTALGGDSKH